MSLAWAKLTIQPQAIHRFVRYRREHSPREVSQHSSSTHNDRRAGSRKGAYSLLQAIPAPAVTLDLAKYTVRRLAPSLLTMLHTQVLNGICQHGVGAVVVVVELVGDVSVHEDLSWFTAEHDRFGNSRVSA